ncbi:MAG: DUF115 domain-containing protein [Asgard group archaeon]|nr:DUF115 domain-containing protein [Asgard group archaeon]
MMDFYREKDKMKNFLGLNKDDYAEICANLNIDPDTDYQATKLLSNKLRKYKVKKSLSKLHKILTEKIVFIFGAGPSLPKSIEELYPIIEKNRRKLAIIAIDGATQALLEKQIVADVVISDLDGGLDVLQKSHQKGSILIIHAHGDNIPKINKITKLLSKNNIVGSTQIDSSPSVKNFGGFTDGDRGVYLAINFPIKMILLIAYDFGNIVGRFSKPEEFTEDFPATERKLIKFDIAKKLLQNISQLKPDIRIYSFKKEIESIKDIKIMTINQLIKMI